MQQARRRVLGAACDNFTAALSGVSMRDRLTGSAKSAAGCRVSAQLASPVAAGQLCTLRGWAHPWADKGAPACSSLQQSIWNDAPAFSRHIGSQEPGESNTSEQRHSAAHSGHLVSSGSLQPSLAAVALLAAAAPVEAVAADGFGPVVAAMQLIDGLHAATGLPWWATLSATAVGRVLVNLLRALGLFEV